MKYKIFYLYKDGKLYDNDKLVGEKDDCYKIIKKYKIPKHITDVKVVKQKFKCADYNLLFIGKDKTGKTQYFYGDIYVNFRRNNKLKSFLRIDSKKDIINKYINDNKVSDFNKLTKESLMSLLIILEFKFYIRTGRKKYSDENNTVGILTLKKKI